MKSNREIKCLARQSLSGKFSGFISLFMTAYIIQCLIVSLPSALLATPKNVPLYISQILLTLLLEALGSMILLGIYRAALKLIRGEKTGLSDLIFAFKNQGDHFLALELIFTIINTLTSIPGLIYAWVCPAETSLLSYYLTSTALSGVAVILTFLLTLNLSMAEFVMLDYPEMTAKEALGTSIELMKGHVIQYFLLILSFLGYIILGFTSAMIGFLWIVPYIVISEALFYENLCELAFEEDDN